MMNRNRYDFVGAGTVPTARQWGALLVATAGATLLALNDFPYSLVPLAIGMSGVVFMLRPPKRNWFVELDDDALSVHLVTTTRIPYSDVSDVHLHENRYPTPVRTFINGVIVLNNFFGAGAETLKPPGEGHYNGVTIEFRTWLFVFLPFPPFLLPRRSWVLRVIAAQELEQDLRARIAAPH